MKTGVIKSRRLSAMVATVAMLTSLMSLYAGLPAGASTEEPETTEEQTLETQSTPSATVDLDCDIDWTGSGFDMHAIVDFTVEGVESITITPKSGGDASITGATWTGDPVELLPWAYDWVATLENGVTGDPPSGEFDLDRDWFNAHCSCPSGTFDLSNTGILRGNDTSRDSLLGEPASPVSIAEGFYDIYLASYDDHSHKPDQTQAQEIWSLADAEDAAGSFESPATSDLPNNLNFKSYHVTAGTGPVLVPDFSDAGLWTVHAAAPTGGVHSIHPACAQFVQDVREVEVSVVATSCEIGEGGQAVGSIEVTIDPSSQATVDVYSDAAKTDLVTSLTSSDTIEDLAPGTYYWEATAETGFDIAGPSEGQVTIVDCDASVTVTTTGECSLNESDEPVGTVTIGIATAGSATVTVYTDAALTDDVLSTSSGGSFELAPGTYHWEAVASSGFDLEGTTSDSFTIEECEGRIIVEKNVVSGDTSEVFDFSSTDLGWAFQLGDGQSDEMAVDPGAHTVEETSIPEGWFLASVSCDDANSGSDGSNGAVFNVEPGETVTCTFNNFQDEVLASILVTVDGSCLSDGGEAVGRISVEIPVDGGATVVISDSGGNTIDTLTESGVVNVDAGATYNWEATASDGFEFPPDFDNTGQVTIEDCGTDTEVLPFTGIELDHYLFVGVLMLGMGLVVVTSVPRRQEA